MDTIQTVIQLHSAMEFTPTKAVKDVKHRLSRFENWLQRNALDWTQPELALYRDELLKGGLSPTSVNSHLSTIRGRYQELLMSSEGRDYFYSKLSAGISPAEAKA